MNIRTITMLVWIGLAAPVAAQGAHSSKSMSPGGSSKTSLSEIRSIVHELQGRTEKLRDLNKEYRSLVEQRPQSNEAQAEKWNAALERLLKRMEGAHAAV